MDNNPPLYQGSQNPNLETNQYNPAPNSSVCDCGCCICSTKSIGIQINKEIIQDNWNTNYFKIINVAIGIFGIIGIMISVVMYIHDPIPDDITFRYLFEQSDVGYPHHWNCFKYQTLFCVLVPIQVFFAILSLKARGCRTNSDAGCILFLHAFNVITWFAVLIIASNAMNSGVTPGGDYESLGITEEGFLLGKDSGCVRYIAEHHIFAYIAIHYVLFMPYTLCVVILAILLVYYIFYGIYLLLCKSYKDCEEN